MSVGPPAAADAADLVQPFLLAGRPVRGRLVRLATLADTILARHARPPRASALLGEALALTAGLAAGLKFEGSFQLQAKGDGPVPMLVADCTDAGGLRGYLRVEEERLAALLAAEPAPSAARLLGAGHLAFTCDQGPGMDRYQGIVEIQGASLAEIAHHYFRASEQIPTAIRLACAPAAGPDGASAWRAAALILQRLPGGGTPEPLDAEEADEAWRTALVLAGSARQSELLDPALPPARLLHRLFHAEGLHLGPARALSAGCRCSRERIARLLAGFAAEDLDDMAVDGRITVTCEFCNRAFVFDRDAVATGVPRAGADEAGAAPFPAGGFPP